MPKIIITQKNLIISASMGANLMKTLLQQNIPVASSCLGDGICGKCRMVITGKINESSKIELETLRRNKIPNTERLACQIIIKDDLTVATTYW